MSTISQVYQLVKHEGYTLQAAVAKVIGPGADVSLWQRMLASFDPTAPKKAKAKKSVSKKSTGQSKRSSMAAMQSALGWATVEAVKRANGQAEDSEVRFVNGCLEVW